MAAPDYPFKFTNEQTKRAVWEKGTAVPGYDPAVWRLDSCGHLIRYDLHGQEVEHGWEIDHIRPRSKGGATVLSNLQPLWWKHNRMKGDSYPWSCPR